LFYTFQENIFGYQICKHFGGGFTKQKIYSSVNDKNEHLVSKSFSANTSQVVWLTNNDDFYQYYSLSLASGHVSKQKLNLPFAISQAKMTSQKTIYSVHLGIVHLFIATHSIQEKLLLLTDL
jgi:hypothetical protein